MTIRSRLSSLKHAWNAFMNLENRQEPLNIGASYGHRPDRTRLTLGNEKSMISAVYTRISMDVASVDLFHVRTDEEHKFTEEIKSGLNECLTVEANIDQAARAFRQDLVFTLFDRGVAAIIPVDTTENPMITGAFDIKSMRVGEIRQWYPNAVKVDVYNEKIGRREEITLPKRMVAIVDNPFYAVMNEPNSTLQRLIRKLNMLDAVDEQSSSGKLDIIIQLPYMVKSEARRQQANQRRIDLQEQLLGSKYGIAYTDGTEKVIQLNRPAENQLMEQVKYLVEMLYGQLGITPEVMNGTADEPTMINYNNRTIEPIVAAITQAMKRTFLTKTARAQGQSIMYFRDPFKLVPLSVAAEIMDKLARNEVISANDGRQALGMRPSKDPKADELRNSNMPQPEPPPDDGSGEAMQSAFAELNSQLDSILQEAGAKVDANA